VAGQRQSRAVSELEERVAAFSAVEDRLHQDAAERLTSLERSIEQEWAGLRRLHEAPVRALQEQATTLAQVSIAASNSGVNGLERAEARLVEIERAIHERLGGVSQQIEQAVAELRGMVPARRPESTPQSSWPIEGVVRLHNQMRESDPSAPLAPPPGPPIDAVPLALPPASPELTARLDSVERAVAERQHDFVEAVTHEERAARWMKFAAAVAAVAVIAMGTVTWMFQRQAREAMSRASQAQQQAQAAVVTAGQQLAVAREQAAKEVATARSEAARAQTVTDVLAAPDLIRYNISGAGPAAISGQVLWSRSRGVVLSAVRVPPVPPRMTYQLWLLTDNLPVTAGTFQPEAGGRVTFTAEPPRNVGPVVGAALTIEPAGGSRVPSERLLVQNRAVRPAPPPPADGPQQP
jgi:anti-sigma-K factor RskA